jgi:hypothetical protein
VWLFMSGCTAKDVSIHHLTVILSPISNVRNRSFEFHRYQMHQASFFQSSSSGCVTHVVKKDTAVCRSGRARLHRYSSFAVR